MTQTIGAAVMREVLWSNDPRVGLDGTSSADQATALQTFLNLLTAQASAHDKVAYLIPGTYKKSAELQLTNTDGNKPITLMGAGSAQNPASLIQDTADAGSGKYALNITSTAGSFTLDGIAFRGGLSSPGTGGDIWGMRGVLLPTYCTVRRLSVQGYHCGLAITGDHMLIEDFLVQQNTYGIEFPPNVTTQGDILFKRGRAGGCYRAGVAVARSGAMAGVRMIDVEASTSPYCILRYDDGSNATVPNWMDGVEIINMATEDTGNSIVYNALSDNSGITGVLFDHGNAGNSNLYGANVWVGQPQTAAWYNTGPVQVTFKQSMPSATATQPAIQAPSINAHCDYADQPNPIYTNLKNGLLPFKRTGSNVADLNGSYIGNSRGFSSLVVPFIAAGTISRGYCLTNNNEFDMVQVANPSGKRIYGIAAHNAVSGGTIHAGVRGSSSDCVAMNTSGVSIPGNTLICADATANGGGVQAYAGSGQVLGRMLYTTASGALGQVDLSI